MNKQRQQRPTKEEFPAWLAARTTPTPWGCLMMAGHTHPLGYHACYFYGSPPILAHRLTWECLRGRIPRKMVIDHGCGLGLCVNIDHLSCVPHRRNLEIEHYPSPCFSFARTCNVGHRLQRSPGFNLLRDCAECVAAYKRRCLLRDAAREGLVAWFNARGAVT